MPQSTIHLAFGDPTSTNIAAIANSPFLWACTIGVFFVIFLQSFLYFRAARAAAPGVGMSKKELTQSFRAGAVASIGPSMAVVLVAISLLVTFGTPAVLVRIGLIGSAQAEVGSAQAAAQTMGAQLGGDTYTQQVFAVAFMAMSLSGAMWMLCTLIFTPVLKRGGRSMSGPRKAAVAIIPTAALLGAFWALAVAEIPKSSVHAILVFISAGSMAGLLYLAKKLDQKWLREWALGIAIIATLVVGYFLHTA